MADDLTDADIRAIEHPNEEAEAAARVEAAKQAEKEAKAAEKADK